MPHVGFKKGLNGSMDTTSSIVISKELASGERLLWCGRPKQGIILRGSDTFLIPFSLLWCGFAIFWEVSVITTRAPFFFKLWGIPFVVVGLYFVFGRFFVEARQRNKTYYGLTDKSIIIVSGLFHKKIRRLNLRTLSDLSLNESKENRGTITFGPTPPFYSWFGGGGWPGMGHMAVPSFDMIENARSVYDLVMATQRQT
jgi:hypothetical protein